jgi:hypothetical protein
MDLGDFHGSLTVRQPNNKMVRKYCILEGDTLTQYDSQEQAMKVCTI